MTTATVPISIGRWCLCLYLRIIVFAGRMMRTPRSTPHAGVRPMIVPHVRIIIIVGTRPVVLFCLMAVRGGIPRDATAIISSRDNGGTVSGCRGGGIVAIADRDGRIVLFVKGWLIMEIIRHSSAFIEYIKM